MSDFDRYYLTVSEVGKRLRLHRSTVYKMIDRGELPAVRIGEKSVRIPKGALDAYLRAHSLEGNVKPVRIGEQVAESGVTELRQHADAFEQKTGQDPRAFVAAWRAGEIEDTAETAELAIQALALRSAMQAAGLVPQRV